MSNKTLVTITHALLTVGQAIGALVFIRLELTIISLVLALAGKWRVFSFNPHRLWRNLRSNSCDMIVIAGTVLLMDFYQTLPLALGFLAMFLVVWLLVIKPASTRLAVAVQAALCQFVGYSALWLNGVEQGMHSVIVILLGGIVAYSSARHLAISITDEDSLERSVLPLVWTILSLQLVWLSWMWSITYRLPGGFLIPQIALLATILGYFAAHHMFVYRDHKKRLPNGFLWQQAFFCGVVVVAIVLLTPWTN